MRYQEIIDEAVTLREFTFDFEFECFMKDEDIDNDNLFDSLPIKFEITDDESLKSTSRIKKGVELVSEVLTLNPDNIIKSKQCIVDLLNEGCYTNISCGFHVHYSYNGMDYNEICWLLIVLSTNDEYRELFTKFKDIDFINKKYASDEFLNNIKYKLNDVYNSSYPDKIIDLFDNSKTKLLRIHPSGTLEWRGPRNFMNSKNFSLISDFFIRLYKVADLIDKISKTKSITTNNNEVITKNSLINHLKNNPRYGRNAQYKKPNNIKDKRFDNIHQNKELLGKIFKIAPWLLKAKFTYAIIDIDENTNNIIWIQGKWISGTWVDGIWMYGIWEDGIWEDGIWKSGIWKDGIWEKGYISTNPSYDELEFSIINPKDYFKNIDDKHTG